MAKISFQRVERPSDEVIDASVDLFVDLMKTNLGALSLAGNDESLIAPMARAMLRAGALDGEYYTATNENGEVVGFTMWMPPGLDLFSTEEQRSLGLIDFMARLPEIGKEYYKTTYQAEFPGFVEATLGPRGKTDAWWLHQAMVRRDYQRQGIARSLIQPVLEKARKGGERLATTTTNDDNIPVYVGLGFKHKASKNMPSPWGEWPIHVFELRTVEQ